jgi:hypothetical protein
VQQFFSALLLRTMRFDTKLSYIMNDRMSESIDLFYSGMLKSILHYQLLSRRGVEKSPHGPMHISEYLYERLQRFFTALLPGQDYRCRCHLQIYHHLNGRTGLSRASPYYREFRLSAIFLKGSPHIPNRHSSAAAGSPLARFLGSAAPLPTAGSRRSSYICAGY